MRPFGGLFLYGKCGTFILTFFCRRVRFGLAKSERRKKSGNSGSRLVDSIKKHGIVDPLYAEFGNNYGRHIKIIVGNNRMATANILKIKKIPIIVNIYDPTFKLEGRELKTDDEIRELFTHKTVNIRRDADGNIDTIMPPYYNEVYKDYEF